jgi:hypothetical protein
MFKMINMNERTEEKMKKDIKLGRGIANKVVLGAVSVGVIYLLGASKGMKIGRARGRFEGYAEATHDIAEMIRQSVTVKTE